MDESRPRPQPAAGPPQFPGSVPGPGPESPPSPPAPAGPAHAAPAPRGTSRRWFLAGGAALVVGAGAGAGAEYLHKRSSTPPPPAPGALTAAAAVERALIADLDATTGGAPEVRRFIVQARADHAAHLAALTALLASYRAPAGSPSTSAPARPGTARTLAQLRAAEQRASAAAAGHAAALRDGQAALLASISACEASHAELLR